MQWCSTFYIQVVLCVFCQFCFLLDYWQRSHPTMPECPFSGLCTGLCNGSQTGYACDNLIDITRTRDGTRTPTICEAEQMLLEHIIRCVYLIQTGRRCQLEHFYIGKTYVRQRKNVIFNHMERSTWKVSGISSRFSYHKHQSYGQFGSLDCCNNGGNSSR